MSEPLASEVAEPDELTEGEPEEEHAEEHEPDEDETAEDETEHEDDAEATSSAVTPEEVERRMKALEKENLRHAKRVGEILEEDATDLDECPRCSGFVAGFIFPPTVAPVDDGRKAAVLASIGAGFAGSHKPAKDAYRCDDCDGSGMVDTGSSVQGQESLVCRDCMGRGWVGPRAASTPTTPTATTSSAEVVPLTAAPDAPDVDPWGRTPEHPDYGRLPTYASGGASV